MNELRIIAISHKRFPLATIGQFHLPVESRETVLKAIMASHEITELMYLSTCNRVEVIFSLPHYVCPGITANILRELQPHLDEVEIKAISANAERYNGVESAEHLLNVASSIDSLVIGEREIITQLRKSYEECSAMGLTGDDIRLVINQCIKTAKEVFTFTDLSRKPVSVVSLAWQQFRNHGINPEDRILLVGSGQIIRNFCKFLSEYGYTNIIIANRTLAHATSLAKTCKAKAISLDQLSSYKSGFDALVSCTGADYAVISKELYRDLVGTDSSKKLVIDLALPADIDDTILTSFPVKYIGMKEIQEQAQQNIQFREKAIEECLPIIQTGMKEFTKNWQARQIERSMQSIPATIREIRETALGSVFAKDLEALDQESRELLEKIMHYVEKKYISIPMKMAREVLLEKIHNN